MLGSVSERHCKKARFVAARELASVMGWLLDPTLDLINGVVMPHDTAFSDGESTIEIQSTLHARAYFRWGRKDDTGVTIYVF